MDAALARLEDAEQRGDVAVVVAELRAHGGSPAHAPVALRACAAVCALTKTAWDNRAKAAAAGVIEALLHTLRAHGSDAEIQRHALQALAYVLVNADRVAKASRLGAVDTVMAVIHALVADADVQAAGFDALNVLMHFSSENCTTACRAGAVDAALAAWRIHKANAQLANLVALSFPYLMADERSHVAIANRTDVVPSFVAVMRLHGSNTNVQENSCRALAEMLCGSSHDKQTLAGAAGAVEALVCALLAFPAEDFIQGFGCAAVCHLVFNHEANAIKAGACGAVEAMMALLRTPGLRLLTVACQVLNHLIGRIIHKTCAPNLRRAIDAGAFDAVVAVVRSNCEDAELATSGCFALCAMLADGVCCQEACRDLAVDTAALVMRAHSQDAGVQDAAMAFLARLFIWLTRGSCRKLAWQGHEVALAAVLAAMQSHVASLELGGRCAGALFYMLSLGDEEVQAKAAALGAFDVIMATMQSHKLDARTQENTCGALEQLITGSPARTRDAATAGAVEAVLSALSSHSAHAEVQFRGYHTLLDLIADDEGNAQRAVRAGALRLKSGVQNAAPELVRCRNAVMRALERAATVVADAAAAELLASEELERGAAAAAHKPGKSKNKRGGGAAGAGGASGSGGGQAQSAASYDAASAAHDEQPPPQAAAADDDEDDAAAPSQLSALAARRRRRTATKAARRRGASSGGAEAAEAAAEVPAPDAQPEEAPDAAPEEDADADDAAAVPLAAQMQQLHVQPPAAAPLPAHDAAENNDTTCVICLDAPRSVLLFPCKHLALCSSPACAAMMGAPPRCPLCRVVVVDSIAGVFL
jgi:hypothetical protein